MAEEGEKQREAGHRDEQDGMHISRPIIEGP